MDHSIMIQAITFYALIASGVIGLAYFFFG